MPSSLITNSIPTPCIMIFLIASIYHLAGTIAEIHCKTAGILSIGNTNPDSIIVGIISPIPEANIAAICVSTRVEMSNPSDKAKKINTNDMNMSENIFPATGTPRTKTDNKSIVIRLSIDKTK